MKSVIEKFQGNGWVFKYEPGTKFIGAYHPSGGKQSICELVNHFESDAFGVTIAEFLNKRVSIVSSEKVGNQRLKGLLAGWGNISKSFKDKGRHNAANVINGCIADLEVLLSISVDH